MAPPAASAAVAAAVHGPRPRLAAGPGCLERLGGLARELGRRALLVTDPGIAAAGHAGRARSLLGDFGVAVTLFDRVRENPTTDDVDACVAAAREGSCDLVVALGGGSALDCAKGANLLLVNGGRMADWWHTGAAVRPLLPLIAVPTTAGTGSECQSFALISDAATRRKMACGHPELLARHALLDPLLTVTQPRRVTAATGLDALGHALETLVTNRRTPVSDLLAREAFLLLHANLPTVLDRPDDLDARGAMQLGAAYAGLAIEHSMLGAAHACANPLTAGHGVVHGEAVALLLPAVIRHNAGDPACAARYADLARRAGLGGDAGALVERVRELLARCGIAGLAERGIPASAIPALAADAATQWTGACNPRPLDADGYAALYRAAWSGA